MILIQPFCPANLMWKKAKAMQKTMYQAHPGLASTLRNSEDIFQVLPSQR